MKVLSVALSLTLAAAFFQKVVGWNCYPSDCSACWKDNDATGVDTKMSCNSYECGESCPDGYHDLHCAKWQRCKCRTGQTCSDFGPCACGTETTDDGWTICRSPTQGCDGA